MEIIAVCNSRALEHLDLRGVLFVKETFLSRRYLASR